MKLEGKVALITGASRGIGRGIALTYAREGATVAINYVNNMEKAENVVAEIKKNGGEAFSFKADVSKTAEVREMVETVIKKYGKIDILVNNAGILIPTMLMDTSDDQWDRVMEINLKGPFLCTREAAKGMIERGYGKIINTASISGLGCAPLGEGAYGVTKAGLIMLTSVLAQELGPKGINVNALAPGWVKTDMTLGKSGPEMDAKVNKHKAELAAMRRIGDPYDIANLALFLASDESTFITGQTIVADGGRADFVSHG
jgi:3-oxoacyl-[acyl-carrier protein] reductase